MLSSCPALPTGAAAAAVCCCCMLLLYIRALGSFKPPLFSMDGDAMHPISQPEAQHEQACFPMQLVMWQPMHPVCHSP